MGLLLPSFIEDNTGWSYVQSTNQAFYIFVTPMDLHDVSGNEIQGYGDGTNGQSALNSECGLNPNGCDVLGAFMSRDIDESTCVDIGGYYVNGQCDVCVGWSYYNSYAETSSGSITTTLLINGFDTGGDAYEHYCITGETPKLKYYDASEGVVYSMSSNIELGSFFNLNIFLYSTDCQGASDCQEIAFIATEDDPLSNEAQDPSPGFFEITSIYPNPFNPSVNIQYTTGSLEHINISVYDTTGRHIATLFDGFNDSGSHQLTWAPENSLSSGNYIITVETPDNQFTRKVTYVK
jgi:hypothetical protein